MADELRDDELFAKDDEFSFPGEEEEESEDGVAVEDPSEEEGF